MGIPYYASCGCDVRMSGEQGDLEMDCGVCVGADRIRGEEGDL